MFSFKGVELAFLLLPLFSIDYKKTKSKIFVLFVQTLFSLYVIWSYSPINYLLLVLVMLGCHFFELKSVSLQKLTYATISLIAIYLTIILQVSFVLPVIPINEFILFVTITSLILFREKFYILTLLLVFSLITSNISTSLSETSLLIALSYYLIGTLIQGSTSVATMLYLSCIFILSKGQLHGLISLYFPYCFILGSKCKEIKDRLVLIFIFLALITSLSNLSLMGALILSTIAWMLFVASDKNEGKISVC
jgi:hypothetical protein